MSTTHVQTADHADAHHEPHVLPLKIYFGTWIALIFLTIITVGASYVDFGAANLVIALLIATTKATLVAMFFMHLLYDHKFHSLIFAFSLIFLGIFIGFTLSDTSARGMADPIEAERPADVSSPFTGTQADTEMKAAYGNQAAPDKPPQVPMAAPAASAAPAPAPASAPASSATPAAVPASSAASSAAPAPAPAAHPASSAAAPAAHPASSAK